MTDLQDIIAFSSNGEQILGVVIDHYTNPLDDFYVVYADYALHKTCNPKEDATIIIDNVIIPACDLALTDYRLKRQHLADMNKYHQDIKALVDAVQSKMGMTDLFDHID